MELVYLWVEKYKNIEKQGFNFSPKFECSYDEKTNELTINDKEHLKNFFGENINVTAIVGENGSGKSSIYKLLLMIIYYLYFKDKEQDNKNYQNSKEIEKVLKGSFLIINDNGQKAIKIGKSFKNNISELKNITFFTTYFNYMLDTLSDDIDEYLWVTQIYHKSDSYDTPLLIQPNKHNEQQYSDTINLYMLEYLTKQKILQFYSVISDTISISNFFKPNYIQGVTRFIHHFRLDNTTPNYIELNVMKKIAEKIESVVLMQNWKYTKKSNSIGTALKAIEDEKDYEYMNLLYIAFKILNSKKDYFNETLYDELKTQLKIDISNDKLPKRCYLKKFDFNNIIIIEQTNYNVLKLEISLNFNRNKIYDNLNFKLLFQDKKLKLLDLQKILIYIPAWIDIEFFEDEKSYESLSSGEKSLFRLILDIMYQFNNAIKEYDTVNFLLDETELGLHPNWQKRYLSDLLISLNSILKQNLNKKVNLIFATHSPFLLSDLPKENVIFLEKGKQVYPFENKQTFGANIHTLLSHGFFMDGLIGEFAKDKINKAITYLNQKALSKDEIDYCEDIISIIGEPIIKNQLQRMLDSKRLSKIDEIDKLKEDMELIKDRIEILRKNQ